MSAMSATADVAAAESAGGRFAKWLTPEMARDRRGWIESKVYIRPKFPVRNDHRGLIPLRLNAVQDILWKQWEGHGFKGVRHVVLKARQEGVSTLTMATFLEEVTHVPNTTAVIFDREAEAVIKKLRVIKKMLEEIPAADRPRTSFDNKNEIVFPDLNSSIYIGMAGARKAGRGDTINLVLLSEFAFYPDPEAILTGILAAVPDNEGMVIIESTADGAETYYHQTWRQARDGESGFDATFLAWHQFPDYRVAAAPGDPKLERTEAELKPPFVGLDDDQIRWYRARRATFKGKTEQEYPSTDESAFLRSGRARFDTERLLECQAAAHVPLKTEDSGALTVYQEPVAGRSYSIGADTAEGIEGGDFDAAIVVDDFTGVEVATLHGSWPTHIYADKLMALGRRYNMALLAIERNNHGHAVLQRVVLGDRAAGIEPYPPQRIYKHLDYDEHAKKQLPRPGWPTD